MRLSHEDGHSANEAAIGDGPVDATLRAIGRAVGRELELTDFQIRALSEGGDAQGQATLGVRHAGRELRGRGVSTDIVEAAALAALEIVNRLERLAPAAPSPTSTTTAAAHAATR